MMAAIAQGRSAGSAGAMIPFSVSDILKILDQIPIWKTVKELPAKVAALEERCATLERRLAAAEAEPARAPGEACKACGERQLRLKNREKAGGIWADMGVYRETWSCGACGFTEERETH